MRNGMQLPLESAGAKEIASRPKGWRAEAPRSAVLYLVTRGQKRGAVQKSREAVGEAEVGSMLNQPMVSKKSLLYHTPSCSTAYDLYSDLRMTFTMTEVSGKARSSRAVAYCRK